MKKVDPTSVAAVATAALVFITIAYTYATWRSFREMERTRLEAVRPALQIRPDVLGVNFPVARITNVGRGNALNIVSTLRIFEGTETRWTYQWREALLAPGASRAFMPELEGAREELTVERIAEERRVFEFAAAFTDAFGRHYEAQGSADWTDIRDHLWGAQALREDPEIPRAVKHLDDIAKHLRGLVDPFVGVKVITHRERLQRDREIRAAMKERQASRPASQDAAAGPATASESD